MNKDSQFKTLTLTKEQIDNKFSKKIYKYQVYDAVLLNMSNTKLDVTTFKQMKNDWVQFMYNVEPDLRGFNNPLMIADEYIELVSKMEKSFSKLK